MCPNPTGHTKIPKAPFVAHGDKDNKSEEAYHAVARQHSEDIFNENWNEKQRIRAAREYTNVPFTRIERAFSASAISLTTENEIENDKEKAKIAASELQSELENIDVAEQMRAQRTKIEQLVKELDDLRKERQPSTISVTSHHTDPIAAPPTVISTSGIPTNGELSYTMQVMLDKYKSLDDESKNELFQYAFTSGNENLQSRLLLLCQNKNGTS
jgi:hypothetical protein